MHRRVGERESVCVCEREVLVYMVNNSSVSHCTRPVLSSRHKGMYSNTAHHSPFPQLVFLTLLINICRRQPMEHDRACRDMMVGNNTPWVCRTPPPKIISHALKAACGRGLGNHALVARYTTAGTATTSSGASTTATSAL